jgi:hypothetical protein
MGAEYPDTQAICLNFFTLVQQAVENGRSGQLSNHPLTQWALSEIIGSR